VAERLPVDFADQVLETVLGHFKIHSVAAAAMYDVPAVAEATWHGACLACAEMVRRGLVSPLRLPELIDWLAKVNLLPEFQTNIDEIRNRPCTLMYAKVHILLVPTCAIQEHMYYGQWPGHINFPNWLSMLVIWLDIL